MLRLRYVSGLAATLVLIAAVFGGAAFAQVPTVAPPQGGGTPPSSSRAPGTTETNRPSIVPFLEGTDVFWSLQKGATKQERFPYRLEANIFPHLVGFQTFTDQLDLDKPDVGSGIAIAISGTPAVRIRMLPLTSAPVRTPSFMPRGNVQLLWVRGLKDCAGPNPPQSCGPLPTDVTARTRPPTRLEAFRALSRVSIWEGHFIIGHHSNGQDGCIIKDQQRDPPEDGPCVPPGTVTADNINLKDGSFSTNYFRLGMNYSRNRFGSDLQAVTEFRFMAEWERHPRGWVDPFIVDLWGANRVNLLTSFALADRYGCKKRFELTAALTVNPDAPKNVSSEGTDVDKLTYSFQWTCFPTTNGGWGPFVRYFNGQDYYNAGFLSNISRLQFGVTFNPSGFFRFGRRPPPAKS